MNPGQSISSCFRKYATFSGRASRSEFWWFFVFQIGTMVLAALIHEIAYYLVSLALLLPAVTVSARRLHDIGKSGWWMLISAVPVLGLIFIAWAAKKGDEGVNTYGPAPVPPVAQVAAGAQ
ncbi:MAG: DUF805 domain-containing protein [Pseudomonadota bacterium]